MRTPRDQGAVLGERGSGGLVAPWLAKALAPHLMWPVSSLDSSQSGREVLSAPLFLRGTRNPAHGLALTRLVLMPQLHPQPLSAPLEREASPAWPSCHLCTLSPCSPSLECHSQASLLESEDWLG